MQKSIIIFVLIMLPVLAFANGEGEGESEQAFPEKAIEIIVPWGAGGNADQQARMLATMAEEVLGVPLAVRNQPGGGTIPGVTEALNAAPDGYTLIWTAIPSVTTVPMMRKPQFSKDNLYPLANVSENTLVLYVKRDSEYQTLDDVLNAANKEQMPMAVNAIGALPHLAAAGLAQESGAQFSFVTEGSSVKAVVALIGGHVEAALAHEPQAFSHGDEIRALAVFEPERSRYLPDIPTAKELGFPIFGFVRDSISINIEAPDNVKKTLSEAFAQVINSEEFGKQFDDRRIKRLYLSPEDTMELWNQAAASYKSIIDNLE